MRSKRGTPSVQAHVAAHKALRAHEMAFQAWVLKPPDAITIRNAQWHLDHMHTLRRSRILLLGAMPWPGSECAEGALNVEVAA